MIVCLVLTGKGCDHMSGVISIINREITIFLIENIYH
jgi:hypothetical protein